MKMLKSELEFVKFSNEDVIVTSGIWDFIFGEEEEMNPTESSPAGTKDYGDPQWYGE